MSEPSKKGKGQARVRQYSTGRMTRCAGPQTPCDRHARVIGNHGPWTCQPCERGEAGHIHRTVVTRKGQQKQVKS